MASAPSVDAYLDLVRRRLDALLGPDLVGVYVIGSLALGGFEPGRSDIDIVAVAGAEPSEALKQRLVDALAHPHLECPSRGLEFVLYTKAVVESPTPGAAFSINLNTGPGMAFKCSFDPASEPAHWFVIDRSIARSDGRRLAGPPPEQVFADMPRRWVLAALLEMLDWHRLNEAAGPNLVLNACRSWRWTEEGKWSSKAAGGAWARDRGGDPHLIDTALARRSGLTAAILEEEAVERLVARVTAAIEAALKNCDTSG